MMVNLVLVLVLVWVLTLILPKLYVRRGSALR